MPIETDNLFQYAVLLEKAGVNNYGEPTVYEPIEITVRWEKSQKQYLNEMNEVVACDAALFVDREIEVGSIVWDGRLVNFSYVNPTNLFIVIGVEYVPDILCIETQRTVYLMKFKDQLPEIVGTGTGT